jgi:hypothetical protein
MKPVLTPEKTRSSVRAVEPGVEIDGQREILEIKVLVKPDARGSPGLEV